MMRRRLSLAVFALLGLAACVDQPTVQQHDRDLKALTERVEALEVRLASRQGVGTLEEQERCSRQAAAVYRELGYAKEHLGNYVSHFNAKLGRCFIDIRSRSHDKDNGLTTFAMMLDAFEMKEYASFTRWEKGDMVCTLGWEFGTRRTCTSEGQFEAWIKQYMTE